MKGPAIFLAQFAGTKPPFDKLETMAQWAASLGYVGVQVPTDPSLFDLELVERRLRARKLREKYRGAFHARTSSA